MTTSRSLNKVLLIGNLTRDPKIRTVGEKGSVVCTFGVATNSTWRDSQGNLQERTEFHNIVAWNKLGEICAQILATGMLVYLEGELRTRTWTDDNGIKHYRVEVKLSDMKLLDAKGKKGVGIDEAKEEGDDDTEQSDDSDVEPESDEDDSAEEETGEDLF